MLGAITGEAAFLSASPKRERSASATGGVLATLTERDEHVLIIKDFTTVLSANRDARQQILAALREIYDGYWSRSVGTDGGLVLEWKGRISVIAAVTGAWDALRTESAALGDRFGIVRVDSNAQTTRTENTLNALRMTGREAEMRKALAAAVKACVDQTDILLIDPPAIEEIWGPIVAAADFTTRARSAVTLDYKGNVIDAPDPESPQRFAKMLLQIVKGSVCLGVPLLDALLIALRVARDSVPPRRLQVIEAMERLGTAASKKAIAVEADLPYSSTSRVVDELEILRVASKIDLGAGAGFGKPEYVFELLTAYTIGAITTDVQATR
jgi:hypothetical protein